MTDTGQRLAICLAIALAAHAGLLAAMTRGETVDTPPAGRTLTVTISTEPSPAPFQALAAAPTDQTGDDRISRRAADRAARPQPTRQPGQMRPAQPAGTPRRSRVSRFAMTAPAATPAGARSPRPIPAPAEPAHNKPERTRSAYADPRATYLAAWKRYIEQRGSRHYPSELISAAPGNRLTLGVTLMANGQLHSVRILQSSGSTPLDRAAQAIVREASPFAPFPPALRADNPRLTFAYDWVFLESARQFAAAPSASR